MSQQPTVGRIVHYQPLNSAQPLAAIITSVIDDDRVNLTVFMTNRDPWIRPSTPFSEAPEEGHWNWPPRT